MKIVHSKKACVICFPQKNILPGMNNLSDAEFDSVVNNPTFKQLLKIEQFYLGGSYDTVTSDAVEKTDMKEKAAEMVKEIQSLEVNDAKEVIQNISDAYLLGLLKKTDGRKGIVSFVEERLLAIKRQDGADLKPVSNTVSDNGSNFVPADSEESLTGEKTHTAIPALKGKK